MWYSVKLAAQADVAEALSEALMEVGALSVSIEDADAGTDAETPQFGEPGHTNERLWEHSFVLALFDAQADLATLLAEAAGQIGLDAVPPFTIEEVAEQNWVQLTQAQFEPIEIDPRLWIVPSWHSANHPAVAGVLNIEMDPGMAFGTGSHPTTRLCLQWLLDTVQSGDTVLDYGCGSGILGITAARLGAAQVLGVDIDEQAVSASAANAERNAVTTNQATWRSSASPVSEQFAIVVANILTNPLCILAPTIAACLAANGRIALSGVLATQAEQVIAAYAPWVKLYVGAEHEGWVRLQN